MTDLDRFASLTVIESDKIAPDARKVMTIPELMNIIRSGRLNISEMP